jgi:hypothetical protein
MVSNNSFFKKRISILRISFIGMPLCRLIIIMVAVLSPASVSPQM